MSLKWRCSRTATCPEVRWGDSSRWLVWLELCEDRGITVLYQALAQVPDAHRHGVPVPLIPTPARQPDQENPTTEAGRAGAPSDIRVGLVLLALVSGDGFEATYTVAALLGQENL